MTATGKQRDWSRAGLEGSGFKGWITFAELAEDLGELPTAGGVYVVWLSSGGPAFLPTNPGGRFKGRDPSVPADALVANWVDRGEVVYIGKADDLRRRLREFARFGAGAPVGHWGGRLIWQLERSAELLVAWKETPSRCPARSRP